MASFSNCYGDVKHKNNRAEFLDYYVLEIKILVPVCRAVGPVAGRLRRAGPMSARAFCRISASESELWIAPTTSSSMLASSSSDCSASAIIKDG